VVLKEDFEVRVMKQMNSDAIALLKEAMKSHPELALSAQLYLNQVSTPNHRSYRNNFRNFNFYEKKCKRIFVLNFKMCA